MIDAVFTEQEYGSLCHYLEVTCGIVLGDNKQYLVRSRLLPLSQRLGFDSVGELIQQTIEKKENHLVHAVIDAMTTNETLWFRDQYPFSVLAEKLLPELKVKQNTIKIWSAACSSGQEPYSIAMTVQENLHKMPMFDGKVSILATDISNTMLSYCQNATYDQIAMNRGLTADKKQKYFSDLGECKLQLNASIRRLVTFKRLNLIDKFHYATKFDIIFCRNVLIYFSPQGKSAVLEQLANNLQSGGYLILGASESLTGFSDRFEMVRCDPGIIYRLK